MELDIKYYLEVKNIASFTTVLDILQEEKVVLCMLLLIIMKNQSRFMRFFTSRKNSNFS